MQSLHLLKRAYDGGLLSAEEFDQWRREMVRELVGIRGSAPEHVPSAIHELATYNPSARISSISSPGPSNEGPAIRRAEHLHENFGPVHEYVAQETGPQQNHNNAVRTPQASARSQSDGPTPVSGVSTQPRFEEIPLSSDSDDESTPRKSGGLCCGSATPVPDEYDRIETGGLPYKRRSKSNRNSRGWLWCNLWGRSSRKNSSSRRKGDSSCGMLLGGCVASIAFGTCLAVMMILAGVWAAGLGHSGLLDVLSGHRSAVNEADLFVGEGPNEKAWSHREQDDLIGKVMAHPQGAQGPSEGARILPTRESSEDTRESSEDTRDQEVEKTVTKWVKDWRAGLHGEWLDNKSEQHCRIPDPRPPTDVLDVMARGMMGLPKCQGERVAWVEHDRVVFNRTLCEGGFARMMSDPDGRGDVTPVDLNTDHPEVPSEVVHAYCHDHHNVVIRQMVKEEALERAKRVSQEQRSPAGIKPDVLVLALDSVSRAQFHRALPRTVSYLNTLKEEDGTSRSFEFLKAMTNHDQAVDNEIELFSGSTSFEQTPSQPWIWDHFRDHGYVTAWLRQPCQDTWSTSLIPNADHVVNLPGCAGGPQSWMQSYSTKPRCFGGRAAHEYTFEYLSQFYDNYHGVGRFAIATLHEGHDETMTVLSSVDRDLEKFLRNLHKKNDNLITYIVSPSGGMRYGKFHESEAGEAEHRLPAMFMVTPSWYVRQNTGLDARMHANAKRLVTISDVYATIRHTVMFPGKLDTAPHVHSLLEEVPPHRSCQDARLERKVCACTDASGSVATLRHDPMAPVENMPTDGDMRGTKVVIAQASQRSYEEKDSSGPQEQTSSNDKEKETPGWERMYEIGSRVSPRVMEDARENDSDESEVELLDNNVDASNSENIEAMNSSDDQVDPSDTENVPELQE